MTLFPELFSLDPSGMFLQSDEIASLSAQIKHLNLDMHTQSIRVEVEKVKRQKLRSKLKRVKREMIPNNHFISQICPDISLLHESMGILRQL